MSGIAHRQPASPMQRNFIPNAKETKKIMAKLITITMPTSLIQAKRCHHWLRLAGHAHALNLKDSGVQVKVAWRQFKIDCQGAQGGPRVVTPPRDRWADVVMILTPTDAASCTRRDRPEFEAANC